MTQGQSMLMDPPGYGTADFSDDGIYRYRLTRHWDEGPSVNFIGLNPSTADALVDDPTIRRCVGFARRWGCGRLVMTNLFALRSTDPKKLRLASDPIGPENDHWLAQEAGESALVICAWGAGGALLGRGDAVIDWLGRMRTLRSLGTTNGGYPRHPLYLRADAEMVGLTP